MGKSKVVSTVAVRLTESGTYKVHVMQGAKLVPGQTHDCPKLLYSGGRNPNRLFWPSS